MCCRAVKFDRDMPLPARRPGVVCSCPPRIRRVLAILDLPLTYLPAGDELVLRSLAADDRVAPECRTPELVGRVQEARHDAERTKLVASRVLARLADTGIRLVGTQERAELAREQGQRILASVRAARDQVWHSRQETET